MDLDGDSQFSPTTNIDTLKIKVQDADYDTD